MDIIYNNIVSSIININTDIIMEKLTFISNPLCPYAERVWITLEQLQIPYLYNEVSLKDKSQYFKDNYKKALGNDPSAEGKLPILIDGDLIITESQLVVYYLLDKFENEKDITDDAVILSRQDNSKIQEQNYRTSIINNNSNSNSNNNSNRNNNHDPPELLAQDGQIYKIVVNRPHPCNTLLPPTRDLLKRFLIRNFIKKYMNVITAFTMFYSFQSKSSQAKAKAIQNSRQVLKQFNDGLGMPYALGDQFTLADVLIYPWLARWPAVDLLIGVCRDQDGNTKIEEWVKNIQKRDSVGKTKQSLRFYKQGLTPYILK